MSKMWVDPPSGWNYGFPKLIEKEELDKEGFNFNEWLIKEGYPESLIKEFGKHFYIRQWAEQDGELGA